MKKLFLILSLFCTSTFAYQVSDEAPHPLSNFSIASDSVPYEFEVMLNHLKKQKLSTEQLSIIITRAHQLNKDLSKVAKKDLMFLLKSETYKGILSSQYLNLNNKLQMSSSVYKSAFQKQQKHKLIYSSFSTWVIEAILKDFEPYLINNFINKYQSVKRTDTKGLIKARKLLKIIKYNSPILESFLTLTPERFNELSTNIIIDVFERVSKKSFYFATYYGKLTKSETFALFNIPEIKTPQASSNQKEATSIEQESKQQKLEAKKAIQVLEDNDLSGASTEIDKISE